MNSEDCVHNVRIGSGGTDQVGPFCRKLLADAEANGFDEDKIFAIHLALEEAFLNAVRHGNGDDPTKTVSVDYAVTPDKFEISITDQGPGFDPEALPDPRVDKNICKCCGRGVLLMRAYMDLVEYNQTGNSVHMIKYKSIAKTGN